MDEPLLVLQKTWVSKSKTQFEVVLFFCRCVSAFLKDSVINQLFSKDG